MTNINNRYEFVYLFDVENGNPNGDPDSDNMPRIDPINNHGLVSDVAIKRRIRNYIELSHKAGSGFDIYVEKGSILNKKNEEARKVVIGETDKEKNKIPKGKYGELVGHMCQKYFDVRTFGAVMSTGVNCGQVRGPVQLSFAKSINPIIPSHISITRMAVTTEKEAESRDVNQTMGRKYIVPYGLYRMHGYISAKLAEHTGFNDDDLQAIWNSLINMYDHDRSASKGEMGPRGLIVFKHDSSLGNAHSRELFGKIKIAPTDDLPSSYADYSSKIEIDDSMPHGITMELLMDPRKS